MRKPRSRALAASTSAIAGLVLVADAEAAPTETVTVTADSGPGSLRQALLDVDDSGTIAFDSALSGDITLTSGQLEIAKSLTIEGPGADLLAVSGDNAFRAFFIQRPAGIPDSDSVPVEISGLTITGGGAAGSGGGIQARGIDLTLDRISLSDNASSGIGGGIYAIRSVNSASVFNSSTTVTRSTISGNTASSGGGAYALYSRLDISDSTLSGNIASGSGGGIASYERQDTRDKITITGTTVTENAAARGGGVNQNSHGTGTVRPVGLDSSIISGNTASVSSPDVRTNPGRFDASNSIIGNTSGATINDLGGNFLNQAAVLGPLADNGGSTLTHSQDAASIGIDTGNPALVGGTDQRGEPRDATPDIGAFELDQTAPSLAITGGPSGRTNDSTPTFTFNSEPGSTVACSIDTGTPDFVACSDPGAHTPAGDLGDGNYTFRVRATDAASNTDTDIRAFTVDTAGPATQIDASPSGRTSDKALTVEFSSPDTDADLAGFQCSVDGAAFNPCTSPFTTAELAEGEHRIEVRGIDDQGNIGPQQTVTFTVVALPDNCEQPDPNPILGTDLGETLTGTPGSDIILGYGGKDTVVGQDANDCLYGGDDRDTVRGKSGDDQLFGGFGRDNLKGNAGDDRINGGPEFDRLRGASGADVLRGQAGDDTINGGGGDDDLRGGLGADRLRGGGGDDVIRGRNGDDTLRGGGGTDVLRCGAGEDKAVGVGPEDTTRNCETVVRRG